VEEKMMRFFYRKRWGKKIAHDRYLMIQSRRVRVRYSLGEYKKTAFDYRMISYFK